MKVKLEVWNKFQSNLEGSICILANKKLSYHNLCSDKKCKNWHLVWSIKFSHH